MYRASSVVLIVVFTRAPDAGASGPPVLRGECEEVFVFELSGTHELHTKWLRREVSRPRVQGGVSCFDRAVRTNCIRSGHDNRHAVY